MTKTFYISGRGNTSGVLQSIMRFFMLGIALIASVFIFMASAAVAVFVVVGIVLLGLIVFSILWLRAKILGKPIVPTAEMFSRDSFATDFDGSDLHTNEGSNKNRENGPILDAHKTPEGWSVDAD